MLIVASAGVMIARIFAVRSEGDLTPFLSANDRSRWCTIRALVDDGTYRIDDIIRERDEETGLRPWHTIDRVRHHGWDGKEHDYSSKPPLLPTLIAGEYWLVKLFTGATFQEQPFHIARTILIFTNVTAMCVAFVLIACLVERYGQTDYGRILTMVVATFATFLTTFAVTLNNHLLAAVSGLIAVYALIPVANRECDAWWRFPIGGLFAAFAVANELPRVVSIRGAVGRSWLAIAAKKRSLDLCQPLPLWPLPFLG